MAHSERANERRRTLYREARQLGLSPRDAGHVYSEPTIGKLREAPAFSGAVALAPSQANRQEAHRAFLEVKRQRQVTLLESREDYLAHNYAKHYTKVELALRTTTGELRHRTVTLTSTESLTRGEVSDRAVAYVEKGNRSGGFQGMIRGSERALLESLKVLEETHYREVSYG